MDNKEMIRIILNAMYVYGVFVWLVVGIPLYILQYLYVIYCLAFNKLWKYSLIWASTLFWLLERSERHIQICYLSAILIYKVIMSFYNVHSRIDLSDCFELVRRRYKTSFTPGTHHFRTIFLYLWNLINSVSLASLIYNIFGKEFGRFNKIRKIRIIGIAPKKVFHWIY